MIFARKNIVGRKAGIVFSPRKTILPGFYRKKRWGKQMNDASLDDFSLENKFVRSAVFIHYLPERLPIEPVVACKRDLTHVLRVRKKKNLLSPYPDVCVVL